MSTSSQTQAHGSRPATCRSHGRSRRSNLQNTGLESILRKHGSGASLTLRGTVKLLNVRQPNGNGARASAVLPQIVVAFYEVLKAIRYVALNVETATLFVSSKGVAVGNEQAPVSFEELPVKDQEIDGSLIWVCRV